MAKIYYLCKLFKTMPQNALNIVYWLMLAAIVAEMFFMVRKDCAMLRQEGYDTKRYVDSLHKTEEHITVKRVLTFALLMMMLVDWVQSNVYDVAILVLVIVGQCVYAARVKDAGTTPCDNRAKTLMAISLALMTAATATVAAVSGVLRAIQMGLLMVCFSYVITGAVNWVSAIIRKPENTGKSPETRLDIDEMKTEKQDKER